MPDLCTFVLSDCRHRVQPCTGMHSNWQCGQPREAHDCGCQERNSSRKGYCPGCNHNPHFPGCITLILGHKFREAVDAT